MRSASGAGRSEVQAVEGVEHAYFAAPLMWTWRRRWLHLGSANPAIYQSMRAPGLLLCAEP